MTPMHGEHRAGDEAVRNHLHHRALHAERAPSRLWFVAHQHERDEDAERDKAHVRDDEYAISFFMSSCTSAT